MSCTSINYIIIQSTKVKLPIERKTGREEKEEKEEEEEKEEDEDEDEKDEKDEEDKREEMVFHMIGHLYINHSKPASFSTISLVP